MLSNFLSRFLTLCDPDPRFVLVWHSITELINSLAMCADCRLQALLFFSTVLIHNISNFMTCFCNILNRSKNPKKYNWNNSKKPWKSLTFKPSNLYKKFAYRIKCSSIWQFFSGLLISLSTSSSKFQLKPCVTKVLAADLRLPCLCFLRSFAGL